MDIHITAIFLYFMFKTCSGEISCNFIIPHGHIRLSSCKGHSEDTMCQYTCDEDYKRNKYVSYVPCNNTGTWTSSSWPHVTVDELCTLNRCSETIIPNGELSTSCVGTIGSSCGYTCHRGFQRDDKVSSVYCENSTNWNANLHTLCTRSQQCLYEIDNGELDLSCNRAAGETCTYTCNLGYMASSMNATCSSSYSWDKRLSSFCTEIVCPVTIPNGYISYRCSREYGSYCHYYWCKPGYNKALASPRLKCNASALWDWTSYEAKLLCIKKEKLCPSTFSNGKIYWRCSCRHGVKCSYSCNPGCTRSSLTLLRCIDNGTWDYDTDLLCENCGIRCNLTFSHGYVPQWCKGVYCRYYCDEGYRKNNDVRSVYCGRGGTWTSVGSLSVTADDLCRGVPACKSIISNGWIAESCKNMSHTSVCPFECSKDCSASFDSLVCQANGKWHNQDIACSCKEANVNTAVVLVLVGSVSVVIIIMVVYIVYRVKSRKRRRILNEQERTNRGANFTTIPTIPRVTTSIPINTRRQERQRFMNEWEQMRPNQGVNFRTRPTEEVTFSIPNAGQRILNEREQERTSQGANLQSRSTETVTTSIPNDVRRFLNECGQERTNQWANLRTQPTKRVTFRITNEGRRIPNELGQERTNQTSQGMNFRTGSAGRVTTSIPNNARREINELEQERANHGANFRTWSTERVTTSTPHVSFGPNADGQNVCSTTTESYSYYGNPYSSSQLLPSIDIVNAAPPEYTSHESPEHGYTAITDTATTPRDPPPSYEETTAHPAYFKL